MYPPSSATLTCYRSPSNPVHSSSRTRFRPAFVANYPLFRESYSSGIEGGAMNLLELEKSVQICSSRAPHDQQSSLTTQRILSLSSHLHKKTCALSQPLRS